MPRCFGLRIGNRGDMADGAGKLGRPAQPSTDYWEEPGEVSHRFLGLFFIFSP